MPNTTGPERLGVTSDHKLRVEVFRVAVRTKVALAITRGPLSLMSDGPCAAGTAIVVRNGAKKRRNRITSSDRPLQAKCLQVLRWGLFFKFETENHTVIFRLRQNIAMPMTAKGCLPHFDDWEGR